jgi:hypothetical protein
VVGSAGAFLKLPGRMVTHSEAAGQPVFGAVHSNSWQASRVPMANFMTMAERWRAKVARDSEERERGVGVQVHGVKLAMALRQVLRAR